MNVRVRQKGLESAIAQTTALRNLLGGGAVVRLELPSGEVDKLTWQAAMDRNVTGLSADESGEVKQIVRDHVAAARAAGRLSGGSGAWQAMYRALGLWMRDVIADKIEDKRSVRKRPLTPAYAAWKQRHVGSKPILVLTGAMLRAVRNAGVRVERKR